MHDTDSRASDRSSSPASDQPTRRPWLVLLIVLSAAFMELIDVSIVNVAIPSIQSELSASYASIEFVLAGYQLGFACVIITAARLGDIYGRKRLFLVGMSTFTVASLASGLATGIGTLVVARVVQGMASGVMFPQVLSTIQVVFAPEVRGKAFAVFGAVVGLAAITGPLAGGALIAWDPYGLDWRTIFLVNVPIGTVAFVTALFLVPESTAPERPGLDWPGTGLVTVGLFALVYPLVQGRQEGWPWWILAMLASSVVVIGLFAWYEVRRTRSPRSALIQMTLFRQRAFSTGNAVALVFFSGLGAFFFVFAITLQVGFGFSALHTGLTVLPFALGAAISSGLSDVAAKRIGVRVLNIGALLLVGGMGWLLWVVRHHRLMIDSFSVTAPLLVSGLGLGLVVAPLSDLILAGVHGDETGSASGVLTAAQRVGGSIGVGVIGVIFFWQLSVAATPALGAVTPGLDARLKSAGLPPGVASQVVDGFEQCFRARSGSADPSARPPACQRLQHEAATTSLPAGVVKKIRHAVQDEATPQATSRSFSRALEHTLIYEVAVFALVFFLCLLLPGRLGQAERSTANG